MKSPKKTRTTRHSGVHRRTQKRIKLLPLVFIPALLAFGVLALIKTAHVSHTQTPTDTQIHPPVAAQLQHHVVNAPQQDTVATKATQTTTVSAPPVKAQPKPPTVSLVAKGVDPRAIAGVKTTGWAVDANEETRKVQVLRYNATTHTVRIVLSTRAGFAGTIGSRTYTTPRGVWHVTWKGNAHSVSNEYGGAPMPYPTYFRGGNAIHADSVNVPSHGCIHVSLQSAKYINTHVPTGSVVVVH